MLYAVSGISQWRSVQIVPSTWTQSNENQHYAPEALFVGILGRGRKENMQRSCYPFSSFAPVRSFLDEIVCRPDFLTPSFAWSILLFVIAVKDCGMMAK
jgi:hypothetical protein